MSARCVNAQLFANDCFPYFTKICQLCFQLLSRLQTPPPSPQTNRVHFLKIYYFCLLGLIHCRKKYLIKIFILIFSFSQIIDQSLISSSHQFNTKTCSEHYHIWQREAANQHIEEAEIGFLGILFWKKYRIHHRNSCWFIQKELQTRPLIYTTSSRRFRNWLVKYEKKSWWIIITHCWLAVKSVCSHQEPHHQSLTPVMCLEESVNTLCFHSEC